MIDALEDLDDVQNVYHNASIPDDVELDQLTTISLLFVVL